MIRVAKAREVGEKFSTPLDSILATQHIYSSNEVQERVQSLVPEYRPQNHGNVMTITHPTVH